MQISSQINKQITDQECGQSDSKQTDSGASEQENNRKYSRKNNIKMCSKCQIHLRGKNKMQAKKSSVTVIGILVIMVILGYVFLQQGSVCFC